MFLKGEWIGISFSFFIAIIKFIIILIIIFLNVNFFYRIFVKIIEVEVMMF